MWVQISKVSLPVLSFFFFEISDQPNPNQQYQTAHAFWRPSVAKADLNDIRAMQQESARMLYALDNSLRNARKLHVVSANLILRKFFLYLSIHSENLRQNMHFPDQLLRLGPAQLLATGTMEATNKIKRNVKVQLSNQRNVRRSHEPFGWN